MGRPSRFSGEMRERAVRLVLEHEAEHRSRWAALQSVAAKIGCTGETLRKWVRQWEIDHGEPGGLTSDEQARLKDLERENRELRRSSAYFAQAELDRRPK